MREPALVGFGKVDREESSDAENVDTLEDEMGR